MTSRTGTIHVELEGRGPLTLRESDYVASGGEASVYKAHGTSVKLYTDSKKMRRDGTAEKIKLLKVLRHPFIMAPEGIVRDAQGHEIGIYMPYAEGEPLPRVFTNAFWQRESFDIAHASTLVERMRDTVSFAHSNGAVMVDGNELNWIAQTRVKNGPEPRTIDVDSWAIGKFGATVVMPSIRDWHTKGFTKNSDWFTWGVVTFQLFTGIHPYRGTRDGYERNELERRMKDKVSVFAPRVHLNASVRDFNTIPPALRSWYEAVFEKGERTIPPSPFDKGIAAIAPSARTYRAVVTATGQLVFEKLFEVTGDPVLRVWPSGVVLLASGKMFDIRSKRIISVGQSHGAEIVKVPWGWLIGDWMNGKPTFSFVDDRTLQRQSLPFQLVGHRFMRFENRMFLATDDALVELEVLSVGHDLLSIKQSTPILAPRATTWFDGVGVQKAFGATFMILPFDDNACTTIRVKELDGIELVTAKAGTRFVAMVGLNYQSGTYQKYELTFTADYRSYTVWSGHTDSSDLNIAILPKGVCATIVKDGELSVFVPTNGQVHRVLDRQIATDMHLGNWEDLVVYVYGGALWKLQMK